MPQVIGGALAAMTAAALGSRLGVAGTVTGAAVASVVATLGGALYTGSLRRTHAGARTLWSRLRAADSGLPAEHAAATPETPSIASSVTADAPSTGATTAPATVIIRPARRVHPLGILVGAAATMVVALAGLTGAELAAGHGLTGQHTTIERIVVRYVTAPDKTTPPDAATPTASPSSSTPEGESPSATPSENDGSASSRAPSPEPSGSTTSSQPQNNTPDATASPHATTPPAPGSTPDTTQSLQALQR